MVEHDDMVGELLKQLDDLGIADNTIVVYGTDNGAETVTWPDGGTTPFHGEKGTTWEGGFRVPMLVRWPGVIKPGTIINDIFSQEDWLPTLLAAAGEPDIVEKLKQGYEANGKTFKVHLDGYNFLPYFKGEAKKGPREEIFYFGQGGDLNAVRWNDWKVHFAVDERQHRHRRARRAGLAGDRQPAGRSLREGAARVGHVHPLVRRQHLALRAGAAEAQGVPRRRCRSIPFQQGSSLNAANINYNSLQAMQAMKRLQQLETLPAPNN